MNDSVHITAANRHSEISKCSTTHARQTMETNCKECHLRTTENTQLPHVFEFILHALLTLISI